MLKGIQAVIFDLDGTLLDRRTSFECFVRDQWERFRHLLHRADQEEYVKTLIELDGDGYAPRKELFAGMLNRLELPSELADTLLSDYRAGFPQACQLFPDALRTLATLRESRLKLGLITNGSVRMQRAKLDCLALSSAFDSLLISDAEGIHKPQREIFERALEQLDVSAARAVFVGDHPEADVAGARAAGMVAVWRRDSSVSRIPEAHAVIDELSELVASLGLESTAQELRP